MLASASTDGFARIWRVSSFTNPKSKKAGDIIPILAIKCVRDIGAHVRWSADSKMIGVASVMAGDISDSLANVSIWNTAKKKEIANFGNGPQAHSSTCVDFSPDGKSVATVHPGGKICLWLLKDLCD